MTTILALERNSLPSLTPFAMGDPLRGAVGKVQFRKVAKAKNAEKEENNEKKEKKRKKKRNRNRKEKKRRRQKRQVASMAKTRARGNAKTEAQARGLAFQETGMARLLATPRMHNRQIQASQWSFSRI